MTKTQKPIFIALAIGIGLTILLAGIKYLKISAAKTQNTSFQPPPEAVTTVITKQTSWAKQIQAVATISAVQGAILAAESPGEVSEILFQSGELVENSKILIKLNTGVEEAQLKGASASARNAFQELQRAQLLRQKNANSQADLDAAISKSAASQAEVTALKEIIDKKTIRAAFTGYTGIRKVNVGQYVNEGQPIVPLFDLDKLYVDFDLPQSLLNSISKESLVKVIVSSDKSEQIAKLETINPNIDPTTRNFSIRAVLVNVDHKLKPGMFVRVLIDTPFIESVIPIPLSSIQYAPYGDTVWVVEDKKDDQGQSYKTVVQHFVKLGDSKGDLIAVLTGLDNNAEIVTSGTFKLRTGVRVLINNVVTPDANSNPQPPNT